MCRITLLFLIFLLNKVTQQTSSPTHLIDDLEMISFKSLFSSQSRNRNSNEMLTGNSGNRIVFKYPPQSVRHKRRDIANLGETCFNDRDCGIGNGQVCVENKCQCHSRFIQFNSTHCYPGILLGFNCFTHSQCSLRVPDSTCVQGFCRCADGKVPYRRANCLNVATLEKSCRSHSQCSLGTVGSECKWIVRNVLGTCQCKSGMLRRKSNCESPGFELGAPCGKTYDCAHHIPGSICVGARDKKEASHFHKSGRLRPEIRDFVKDSKYSKKYRKRVNPSLAGVCQCPTGYLAAKNGSRCVPIKKDIGVSSISLGKQCLFSSQCQASDPYSQCLNGICECQIDSAKCSSNNTGCHKETFQCVSDGRCVSAEFVCDGKRQCHDGSDEMECDRGRCSPFAFACREGSCIARGRVCDGQVDCPDESDENSCQAGLEHDCPRTTFACEDGGCVPGVAFCNALPTCRDHSDEDVKACVGGLFPLPTCPFRCKNGRCRSTAVICSGTDGCGDLSDEENCSICNCPKPREEKNTNHHDNKEKQQQP